MRAAALSTEKKQKRFKQSCSVVSRRTNCNKYQSTVDPHTRQQIKDKSEAPLRSATQDTGLHLGVAHPLYDLIPALTAGLMASEGPKDAAVLADTGADATDITPSKANSCPFQLVWFSMHLDVDVAKFLCYCSSDASAYTMSEHLCMWVSGHTPGCNLTCPRCHSPAKGPL